MTVGRLMKKAGYSTAVIGKWHLGFTYTSPVDWNKDLKPGPLELGFDYYFGVPVLNSHPPFVYVENHRVVGLTPEDPLIYGEKAETEEFPEKWNIEIGGGKKAHALYKDRMVGTTLKNKAIEWIKEHKNEPFFLYFATTNIHHPFTPAERFVGTSEVGRYGDSIHELDWMVGEVLDALDEEGLRDNTLVIFTSDNGGMLNQGGQDAWKAGHRLNGNLGELLANVDILATLAALVEYPLKKGEGPDSYNMMSALTGSPANPIRDHLIISPAQGKNLAIRKGSSCSFIDQTCEQ
ncbi:MAG: sulfatase-like hydrolase/transferase [Anditalea sp.]